MILPLILDELFDDLLGGPVSFKSGEERMLIACLSPDSLLALVNRRISWLNLRPQTA
jgi:hypothetical protein